MRIPTPTPPCAVFDPTSRPPRPALLRAALDGLGYVVLRAADRLGTAWIEAVLGARAREPAHLATQGTASRVPWRAWVFSADPRADWVVLGARDAPLSLLVATAEPAWRALPSDHRARLVRLRHPRLDTPLVAWPSARPRFFRPPDLTAANDTPTRAALYAFDAATALVATRRVDLAPGDLLVVDNRRALHGAPAPVRVTRRLLAHLPAPLEAA